MISVIIPLYNKEAIVERSLRSVLSQDYDDFEIIVVNDGSTDKSADIVRSINDPRIHIIEQENGGPSKARNIGVKYAKGDWILFLDADDELLLGALRCFGEYIHENPEMDMFLGGCSFSTGACITYKEGMVKSPFKAHAFGLLNEVMGSMVYRKTICLLHHFDEKLWRFEDLHLLFELYRRYRLYLCSQLVVRINIDFSSASSARRCINEDFVGHIEFKNKSFWEKMCLYKLFVGERPYYTEACKEKYPSLFNRYDLLLLFKLIGEFRSNRTILRIMGLSQFIG